LDIINIESTLEIKEITIYPQDYIKEEEVEDNKEIINRLMPGNNTTQGKSLP